MATPSSAEPTPQLKKLGIVPGARWDVVDADPAWSFAVAPDPGDRSPAPSAADVVVAFVRSAAEVAPAIDAARPRIFPSGAVWVAWPRRAGGHVSDVTDGIVRDTALAGPLVDVKVAAIDDDWSGLKLVWRRELR